MIERASCGDVDARPDQAPGNDVAGKPSRTASCDLSLDLDLLSDIADLVKDATNSSLRLIAKEHGVTHANPLVRRTSAPLGLESNATLLVVPRVMVAQPHSAIALIMAKYLSK